MFLAERLPVHCSNFQPLFGGEKTNKQTVGVYLISPIVHASPSLRVNDITLSTTRMCQMMTLQLTTAIGATGSQPRLRRVRRNTKNTPQDTRI